MTFWILAILITATACAALYYAAAVRTVNARAQAADATMAHFRLQLREIDGDIASGRIGAAEAQAAKGEMAREMLRLEGEEKAAKPPTGGEGRGGLVLSLLLVALLAFGIYSFLGNPQLPSVPLAGRSSVEPIDLKDAVAKIEARLKQSPDDLRGWTVIAPAYVQAGRLTDAVHAYRRINELAPPTADSETDLGEAIMMLNNGLVAGEAMDLFKSAAKRDPKHVRSRFYIAAELTRAGDYQAAVDAWNELLALGKGDEPWVVTANNGLAAAKAGLSPGTAPSPQLDNAQIRAMVDGLDARLKSQGGSIAEWTQLVRSRMVLGDNAEAQAAYDAARKAYPDAAARTELDVLAADNGLIAKDTP